MDPIKQKFQDMLFSDIDDHLNSLNDLFLSEVPDLDWVDYHHSRAATKLKILKEVFADGV